MKGGAGPRSPHLKIFRYPLNEKKKTRSTKNRRPQNQKSQVCGLRLQVGVSWSRQVRVAGPKNRRGTVLRLAQIIQSPESKIEQSSAV